MSVLNIKGLTVFHHQTNSDIINVRIIVNAGATSEREEEYGVAHYLEHMFFKGTQKRSYKEVNKLTSELGNANAYTSRDRTVFYLSTLSSEFERAADILTEMFLEPSFPQEEFDKERTVILEEYQSGMDDPIRFFHGMSNESFMGSKRGHKVIGNRNTISGMTIDHMKAFRARNYVVDNMAIAVIGNVSEDRVIKQFEGCLSDVPSDRYVKLDRDVMEYDTMNLEKFEFNHDSKQAVIGIMIPAQNAIEEFDGGTVQEITAGGIGWGMHSLFFDRIREELGLCYAVGMWLETMVDVGHLTAYCLLDQKNIDQVFDEMVKIFAKVSAEGFDSDTLEITKKHCLFGDVSGTQTSSQIGKNVIDRYFKNGCRFIGVNDKRDLIKSVTNDDVIKYAQTYLKPENMKFVRMTSGKE